jgi:DNA-directed RNA polymerase specialized sigma24 family protein
MTISLVTESLTTSPERASWCSLLLDHLDEFATLAWYLVADGRLVEDTFARTMAKLDMTAFESSIPALAYSHARDVVITEAIAVVSDARRAEDETQVFQPNSIGGLPDLGRLAFMLKLIVRSSEVEVASDLGVSRSEVREFVRDAIDHFSVVPPVSPSTDCYVAQLSFVFGTDHG